MRFLLDTHGLLWWATGDSMLSAVAHDHIQKESIIVSAASVWEIAIKFRKGKLALAERFVTDLPNYIQEQGFTFIPITPSHALRAGLLPIGQNHADPFDRMLVAQALEESHGRDQISIISNDDKLDGYGVTRIW
jgi:PIN domain nuclease of toxin-antitoxin system